MKLFLYPILYLLFLYPILYLKLLNYIPITKYSYNE